MAPQSEQYNQICRDQFRNLKEENARHIQEVRAAIAELREDERKDYQHTSEMLEEILREDLIPMREKIFNGLSDLPAKFESFKRLMVSSALVIVLAVSGGLGFWIFRLGQLVEGDRAITEAVTSIEERVEESQLEIHIISNGLAEHIEWGMEQQKKNEEALLEATAR